MLPPDWQAMGEAAKLFTRSLMMGLDSAVRKAEFAEPSAEDIENMPYHEAVEYLKKRDVIKKVDYDSLSDRMRFRAFTASRIADGDLLKKLNAEMIASVNDGKGLQDFLALTKTDILDKIGMGAGSGWYYETVYRTDVQTAYNVGRAMGFAEDKPLALELVIIDDSRTSDICRQYAGKRFILPYDHPFWQTHWPPFHFNCRTTIRAIYDESELPENWSNPKDIEDANNGFGAYPLSNDSWWEELSSQVARAKEYGLQGEILGAKEILIDRTVHSDFTPSKSIEDAQSYAEKTFIQGNGLDGVFNGKVDFSGISLEHANEINRVLSERFTQFPELPKLSGLKTVSPSSKLGKKAFSSGESMASYDLVRNGIFLNKDILKNEKAFQKFIEDSRRANDYVMKNVEKLSGAQKSLVERYIKAGRTLVDGESIEGILNHEIAHHIELNFIRTNKELYFQLIKNMNTYAGRVSGYATSAGNEYLAESIAAYMKGEKKIIDPILLKTLESKLSAKGLKTVIKEVAEINCVIPEAKLTKYVLDTIKYVDKAKVFKSALGYTIDNWQDLEQNILANVEKYPMIFVESKGKWGDTFRCDMLLKGPNGNEALVRTGWILRPETDVYQFTTAYVL